MFKKCFYEIVATSPWIKMARRVARKKRPCSKAVSTTSLFYIFCSCLCVSYPVLASINERVQGSTLPDTSLKFCEHYEVFLSTSYELTHSHGYLGMLNQLQYHFDNQIVLPKLRHKCKGQPKSFSASSLVQSFVLIVCTAESILYSLLMFFVGIGALITMHPLLGVSCVPLVLGAYIVHQDSVNIPQSFDSDSMEPQREKAAIYFKCGLIPDFVFSIVTEKSSSLQLLWVVGGSKNCKIIHLYSSQAIISIMLLMSGDIETNPGPILTDPKPKSHSHQNSRIPPTPDVLDPQLHSLGHTYTTQPTPSTEDAALASDNVTRKVDVEKQEKAISMVPYEQPNRFIASTSDHESTPRNEMIGDDFPSKIPSDSAASKTSTNFLRFSKEVSNSDLQAQSSYMIVPAPPKLPSRTLLNPSEVHSFCVANDCYRKAKSYIINRNGTQLYMCPLCGMEYDSKGRILKSHVIPRCVFEVFRNVHGNSPDIKTIIYDFSTGDSLNPQSLTHRLLCHRCEESTRDVEEKLKYLYAYLLANPNSGVCYNDSNDWLWFVLANIMFRGLLVHVKLTWELFQDQDFDRVFHDLWMYCKETDFNERPHRPNFKLFLLPNRSMNEELKYLLYSLELFLRMPCYTQLVSLDTGTFLYTKFDCFHLVLPIHTKIFDDYKNGLSETQDDKTTKLLSWSLLPVEKPILLKHQKKWGIKFRNPSHSYFPSELIQWNWEFYGKYLSKVYCNAHVQSTHLVFLDRYIGDTNQAAICLGDSRAVDIHKPIDDHDIGDIGDITPNDDVKLKAMMMSAAKTSPIRDIVSSKARKEKLIAIARYLKQILDELGAAGQAFLMQQYTTAKIELRIALTDSEHILHLLPLERLMEEIIEIRERQQRETLTRERDEEIRIIQDEYDDKLKEQSEVLKAEVESQMARAEHYENQLKNEIEQSEIQHKTRVQGLLLAKDKEIEKLKEKIASLEQERYQENHDLKMEVVKMKYKIKERELEDRHAEEEKEMHEHLNDVKKFFDDFRQKQAEDKERKEKQLMKHLKRLLQIPKQAGPRRSISLTAETDTDYENETTTEVLRSLSSTCNC